MISSIFACKIREAIISVLTERAAPLRCSLNRADAVRGACALVSRRCSNTKDYRVSLKFVQEVARFVTSHFFGGKKSLGGSEKGVKSSDQVAKLATLRVSLLLTSLSVWLQQHTWRIFRRTHTYSNIWTTANQRGVRPSLSLIDLDNDISLMCVCFWTSKF